MKTWVWLAAIFGLAVGLRFAYFPGDIYFGYDQARDAFVSLEAMRGDIKVVGPPATLGTFRHGALFYYLFGPIYVLGRGDPVWIAAILRIYNALGVFVVFCLGWVLYNKKIGLIAALLYAVSFEQTQYALFLGHPALAVLPVLIYYLGLAWFFVRGRKKGLLVAAFGLGLAVQFHLSLVFLAAAFAVLSVVFRDKVGKLSIVDVVLPISVLAMVMVIFIIGQVKAGAATVPNSLVINVVNLWRIPFRYVHDNLLK